MIEASRTSVSPAGIWAVVVVAVACLGFWLVALTIASRNPGARRRGPDMPGPVLGGTHVSDCGRSVAPNRDFAAIFDADEAEAIAAASAASAGSPVTGTAGRPPDSITVPGQRTPGAERQPETPVMPTQRSGDADRPERTSPGPRPNAR